MTPIRAVICDFGGVLTNPLWEAFAGWNDTVGADPGVLGRALQSAAGTRMEPPVSVPMAATAESTAMEAASTTSG